ncbi:hypothetical protein B5F10_03540 [Anaerotruncus colihominis]|uniref:Carboxyvinyl-carboxyphosphonate phosphorylmutase n=1 Tax=Anaerotruncus colihominis TaxID=169435 RepID=A0A1Y4N4C9_9FIRM|nr:isocitrate lyase/PEP mutase family protein [Anaerotruncus colihominis]OUP71595.1 hypothetical protein B5F11_01645 [Anaerotruncus colihominis]OUP75758.1 hypothetical protein B5F10_03540 [Anaerotruncus colihominis]
MTITEKRAQFKARILEQKHMSVLCGAFDGITARAAQAADFFDGCYMGGQAAAASMLGVPDLGLVCASEQVKHVHDLTCCVDLPFLVDADTGYGNTLNVRRTVADLEAAGVCGAHFEDQVTPKRCGGMQGVEVEDADVFVKKIETALRWRSDPNFLVIARSDAASVYGQDEVIRRLNLAADVGADMGFLFSSQEIFPTLDDVKRACDQVRIPILYCLMEFCPEVCFTLDELRQAGVRAVIWPNGLLMRWCKAASDLIEQFKRTGDCKQFYHELMPIEQCNQLLGIREWNPPGMF